MHPARGAMRAYSYGPMIGIRSRAPQDFVPQDDDVHLTSPAFNQWFPLPGMFLPAQLFADVQLAVH